MSGHWIHNEGPVWGKRYGWHCSECGFNVTQYPDKCVINGEVVNTNIYDWEGSHYCPCCGAKMGEREA